MYSGVHSQHVVNMQVLQDVDASVYVHFGVFARVLRRFSHMTSQPNMTSIDCW